jgi:hypothetical protein
MRKEDPDIKPGPAGGLDRETPAELSVSIVKTVELRTVLFSLAHCMGLAIVTPYPTRPGEQHGGHMQPCPDEAITSALINTNTRRSLSE